MKLRITGNEGEVLGQIHQNFEFEADIPVHHKERIRSLIRSSKKFKVDVGPVERGSDGYPITPGERMTEFSGKEALPRLKVAIDRLTPYHAEIIEDGNTAIKTVDNPWEAPDDKEVHEGPPGVHYYNVSKDDEDDADGEVLEIRDYYRIWVKDRESVPDDCMALYDEAGDEAGNNWYYEAPFETTTRIDLSDVEVNPRNIMEKGSDADMTPEEINKFGVREKDFDVVKEAAEAVENGEHPFGNTPTLSKGFLKDISSPITLLSLYKTFHNGGSEYVSYLPPIQSELQNRGVRAVDKITRKRRDFGAVDDENVTLEKDGDRIHFERD